MTDKEKRIYEEHFDSLLKHALEEEAEEEAAEFLKKYDNDEPVEYSESYNKAIEKIFRENRYRKKRSMYARVAAVLAVFVISAGLVSYKTDADFMWFISRIFTDGGHHVEISNNKTNLEYDFSGVDESWEKIYVPDYVPAGYKVDEIDSLKDSINIIYKKGQNFISVEQCRDLEMKMDFDIEQVDYSEITINGYLGYCIKYKKDITLRWSNGEYNFTLYGDIDKKELIKMAESLKTVNR